MGFGISLSLCFLAHLSRFFHDLAASENSTFPLLADYGQVVSALPFALTLIYLTDFSAVGRPDVRRLCQYGIILTCAVASFALLLNGTIGALSSSRMAILVAMAYSVLDPSTALFGILGLAAGGRRPGQSVILLLVLGIGLRGFGNLLYIDQVPGSANSISEWIVLIWAGGFLLMSLAAIERISRNRLNQNVAADTGLPRASPRARIIDAATPVMAAAAVVIVCLATSDVLGPAQAAIILPTLLLLVSFSSIGEWWTRGVETSLRYKAEEKQTTLAGILGIIPDAVISVNAGGRICLINRFGEKLLGYDPDELLDRPLEILIPDRFRSRHRGYVDQFSQAGRSMLMGTERAPIYALRRDGSEFPVEASVHRIDMDQGHLFIAVLRDISERVQYSKEIRDAREQAILANRAKSDFLANMSHELRTPLNAIIGFSEIIERRIFGNDTDRYTAYASDIRQSGDHLLAIINDILDLSKIEAGRLHLTEEAVYLPQVIAACLHLVSERAGRANVRLVTDVPAALPPLWADAIKVKQILINLLTNAVKFTPAGGTIVVGAHIVSDGRIAMSITDTGIGMRPEDIPAAMAPFGQVDSGPARRHEGTGLGLPLTRRLAELHGAEFRLESQLGRGTTVSITFPKERVVVSPPTN